MALCCIADCIPLVSNGFASFTLLCEQWHCLLYTSVASNGITGCIPLWWVMALLAVYLCGEQWHCWLYASVVSNGIAVLMPLVSSGIAGCIPLLWAVSLYAYVYGEQYYCNLNACGEQWHCMPYTSGEQWVCMLYTSVVSSDTSSCVPVWWAAILHAVYLCGGQYVLHASRELWGAVFG